MKTRNIVKTYIYQKPYIKVREDKLVLDGVVTNYTVVERADSAVIIPLTSSGQTLLFKQYRYPIGVYLLELPDGGLQKNETAREAAIRELYEETHLHTDNLENIGWFNPVPGISNQRADVFIARIEEEELKKAIPNKKEGIDEIIFLHFKDVFEKVNKGEIRDGFTLSSLLILKIYLEKRLNKE